VKTVFEKRYFWYKTPLVRIIISPYCKGVVRGEDGVVRRRGVHKFHGLHEDEGYLALLRGKLWQWTVVVLLASGTFALVSTPGR